MTSFTSHLSNSTPLNPNISRILSRWQSSISATSKKPFVTLTYAQSLDGSISSTNNQQLLLSCHESLKSTHTLRRIHDAICVGVNTANTDNPRLTARLGEEYFNNINKQPRPVIFDTFCNLHTGLKVVTEKIPNRLSPIVVCAANECSKNIQEFQERRDKLKGAGCQILECNVKNNRIDIEDALLKLYNTHGINTIMIEGGARIIDSFLKRMDLVDQIIVTISPQYIGGLKTVSSLLDENKKFPKLKNVEWLTVGEDVIMIGDVRQIISNNS